MQEGKGSLNTTLVLAALIKRADLQLKMLSEEVSKRIKESENAANEKLTASLKELRKAIPTAIEPTDDRLVELIQPLIPEPIKGDRGEKGLSGKDGKNGKDGVNGRDGKNGLDGKDGRNGIDGKNGRDGKDGKSGKDGAPGKDGKTAGGISGYSFLQRKWDYLVHTQTAATRNHSAKTGWEVILCDCTSNAITVNLPTAIGNQARLTIKKIDSSGNAVTVAASGSQKIDGASTATISAQYSSVTVVSDNANWHIV